MSYEKLGCFSSREMHSTDQQEFI